MHVYVPPKTESVWLPKWRTRELKTVTYATLPSYMEDRRKKESTWDPSPEVKSGANIFSNTDMR